MLTAVARMAAVSAVPAHARGFLNALHEITNSQPLVYREKKIVRFSSEQVFDVVADVDRYKEFIPWCQRSRVLRRPTASTLEGELCIGFQSFNERFLSSVTLQRPHRIRVAAQRGLLFRHLITTWQFEALSPPSQATPWGTTRVAFEIDFQFESALYRQASELFLNEVAKRMVSAFDARCLALYGRGPRTDGSKS
eukprot:Amastigsp_a1486_38.p1 type:complete len:195 gc:universal Amastigsp_a1486_38:674-90(-)